MAITIPYQQTEDPRVNKFQQSLKAALQPLTSLPMSEAVILTQVSLVSGSNTIPHTLGRKLQGWYPVRLRSSATLYDTQDTNTAPAQTLTLVASSNVTVDLVVF